MAKFDQAAATKLGATGENSGAVHGVPAVASVGPAPFGQPFFDLSATRSPTFKATAHCELDPGFRTIG